MIKLRSNCIALGVSIPPEVTEFLKDKCKEISPCPPNRPDKCGHRLDVTGIESIKVKLNSDWRTDAILIDIDELPKKCKYILLMDEYWNARKFV
ncbi:MAG: hypothetical protein DRJ15_10135 [Bacteroidetes bacterium]|nr:MAG: hypothetical protein DRJ15_10135 [Bacteroidota bacterium]